MTNFNDSNSSIVHVPKESNIIDGQQQTGDYKFGGINERLSNFISYDPVFHRSILILTIKVLKTKWSKYFPDNNKSLKAAYKQIDPKHEENFLDGVMAKMKNILTIICTEKEFDELKNLETSRIRREMFSFHPDTSNED